IAINGELEALAMTLPKAFRAMRDGGVLAVISFHSLEDRIVKRFMRKMSGRPIHRGDSSFAQDRTAYAEMVQAKAIFPSKSEVESNPRSRSARLRVLRKISQPEI
ncbi:MAG: 16S rRNA (cytosine(1402)-N(4))-methyltransferase, partial [Verrucomicrobiota bacterium]|nr:16S rRNA (cytosine(1402)-N(4))-methyltransferase [Verrucomicrobiota bacterium]